MNLVLLETSGNQAFIFATNRLRENIGASELTYRAGTRLVLDAVREAGGPALWSDAPKLLRDALCNPQVNVPIVGQGSPVEVLVATSGKALLLVKDGALARDLVSAATRNALEQAPGIDLCGAISSDFAWESTDIHQKVREVHALFEGVRSQRPGPLARFPALPVSARCGSSGGAAYDAVRMGDDISELSRPSVSKRKASAWWGRRVNDILADCTLRVADNVAHLEEDFEELDWWAVVHADGNGLGRIFLEFDKHLDKHVPPHSSKAERNAAYVDTLRRFSVALEEATEAAFAAALNALSPARTVPGSRGRAILPVVPLVLGGDDLTVIADGRVALEFTRHFLTGFEHESSSADRRGGVVRQVARAALGCDRLSACAGVAVIKPHFPFHTAYRLAEELLQSAKAVKRKVVHRSTGQPYPCSAFDFHVLFDSTFTDLQSIRERLTADRGATRLTAKPYVVTSTDDLAPNAEALWAQDHHAEGLSRRIEAIRARDEDGRRKLPNTQLHDLREGLFMGHGKADARMGLIRARYGQLGLDELLERGDGGGSLFRQVRDERHERETRFLDALEAQAFWGSSGTEARRKTGGEGNQK